MWMYNGYNRRSPKVRDHDAEELRKIRDVRAVYQVVASPNVVNSSDVPAYSLVVALDVFDLNRLVG